MLKYLADYLSSFEALSFFRVFDFLTVRAGLALVFSFLFCLVAGPMIIRRLAGLQAVQYIRQSVGDGAISLDEMHKHKGGVPTMGGIMMLFAILIAMLLFGNLTSVLLWTAMGAMIAFASIGFLDDYLKCVRKRSGGLDSKQKLVLQIMAGLVFALIVMKLLPDLFSYSTGITEASGPDFFLLPFLKDGVIFLGLLYIPFAVLVLTATSNAVNLTDGLDGLAAGVTVSVTICFAIVAYIAGRPDDAAYLFIPSVRGAGELSVLLAALCGACFGFLWFNSHPAQVFMGDTGSMMLGGLLGAVALLTKQEFLLLIVGGIFVAEALSVILQVGSYKMRKKRIFRMAPLHHHFERGGIPESKIIARFYIVSALLALAGLVSLKLR